MRGDPPILAPAPAVGRPRRPRSGPVPLIVLTGFLGAGKTTLLNRILNSELGLRVGVLVNDFGAVNIDAALVDAVEDNKISLTNGCVCCEIRDDLVTSVEELLGRGAPLEVVVLEASGVADPAGVVMTFQESRHAPLVRLDGVICVVDAEGLFTDDQDGHLTALKLRQIAFSDLVVLNKTDLVSPAHVEVARDWIDLHIKRIRVVEAVRGEVPMAVLLGSPPERRHSATAHRSPPPDGDRKPYPTFERWTYRTSARFSPEALQRMVKRDLPASVYRCKGVIYTAESDQAHALHVVGRRCEITPLDRKRGGDEGLDQSEVVAIGRELDDPDLDRLFTQCLVDPPVPPTCHDTRAEDRAW